jgi:glycosyltransferase involved in cell wall biosynthesis
MPIKVMNYLSYGRPMLVTRCREITRFVEENQLGLVVDDNPESMADGIRRLFTADLDELNRMGQNALRAVREKHSWHHRARQILGTFEEIRQRDS